MSPFPFFQLPLLASRRAFELVDPTDRFNLSLTSSRIHRFMEKSKYKCERISFDYREGVRPYAIIQFSSQSMAFFEMSDITFSPKEIYISIHKFTYSSEQGIFNLFYHHNFDFGFAILFKHLLSLFSGPIRSTFKIDVIDNVFALISHPELQKCDRLTIKQHDSKNKLDEDDLEEILEKVQVKDKMSVMVPTRRRIALDKYRHLHTLELSSAPWLRLSDLISLKCSAIVISNHRFSKVDLFRFIDNWKAGNMENLDYLQLSWRSALNFHDTELDSKFYDGKRRPKTFEHPQCGKIDIDGGLDVIRADGRIGTVLYTNWFNESLFFFIWKKETDKKTDNN